MAKLPELDRRAKHTVISLIATCFLSVGCKDEKQPPALVDKPTVDETSPNKNGTTPRSGAFSIDEIRVSASQNVFLAEGLPTDKELKACIEKQLLASPAFEKTGRPVTGTITYDYQGKDDAFMIALYGQFSETSIVSIVWTETRTIPSLNSIRSVSPRRSLSTPFTMLSSAVRTIAKPRSTVRFGE